jgi:hypothetical protein
MYEPTSTRLVVVKSRLSPQVWDARVEAARKDEVLIKDLIKQVRDGRHIEDAIKEMLPLNKRSWAYRRWTAYQRDGFEALIDARVPRTPRFSRRCMDIIQSARLANPQVTVDEVLKILQDRKVGQLPSEATIKRDFHKVDERRRYAEKKKEQQEKIVDLPLAGGELLWAAEQETGLMGAVTNALVELSQEAKEASTGREPQRDVERRDKGKFTASYNRARTRKDGEQVASYMLPAADKGADKVPSWPRFVDERPESLHRKVMTLTLESLVNPSKGWDGLRAPGVGASLESLVGFGYMPSTLSKLTSALAQSSAGDPLLLTVGVHWHGVAQQRWQEDGAIAALYVDNHAKEVWSKLFTQSGKVSHRSCVMPAITTTYVHTGVGTPVWVALRSGSAPLAPSLCELVEQVEARLGDEITRVVVIDAEGSTFDVLASFIEKERIIVTPMRPKQAGSLDLRYGPGSYYRPFRPFDEYRVAHATLHHKSTGRSLELSAVTLRRTDGSGEFTLLTNGPELGSAGKVMAQVYLNRWQVQENSFKHAAASVKLNEHRGNCGRIVSNVTVVTKLEKLEGQIVTAEEKLGELTGAHDGLEHAAEQAQSEHRQVTEELARSRARVDELLGAGAGPAEELAAAAVTHHETVTRSEVTAETKRHAEGELEKNLRGRQSQLDKIEKMVAEADKLEPRQQIRQLDVALDSVMTSFKLMAFLLINFVIREYLSLRKMTAETFVSRILSYRGRREERPNEVVVVFYENPRDPEMNTALAHACIELERRELQRGGRRLHYRMEKIPENPRPPPVHL